MDLQLSNAKHVVINWNATGDQADIWATHGDYKASKYGLVHPEFVARILHTLVTAAGYGCTHVQGANVFIGTLDFYESTPAQL
jgi:hypothetical protein